MALIVSQTVILIGQSQRDFAKRLIDAAPKNAVVKISPEARSLDANAKMWACLSDIARAKPDGRHWTAETWKSAFLHALGHQVQFAEGLDNSGPFPLGFRSSKLTKPQMANLITVIQEYGDRHGVIWSDA
jgi:hypothetical protein